MHIPNFAGAVAETMEYLPVHDTAAADAGADGQHDHNFAVLCSTGDVLGEPGAVDIVFHFAGQTKQIFDVSSKRVPV